MLTTRSPVSTVSSVAFSQNNFSETTTVPADTSFQPLNFPHGHIHNRYKVKAKISRSDIHESFDCKAHFSVTSILDLNHEPRLVVSVPSFKFYSNVHHQYRGAFSWQMKYKSSTNCIAESLPFLFLVLLKWSGLLLTCGTDTKGTVDTPTFFKHVNF